MDREEHWSFISFLFDRESDAENKQVEEKLSVEDFFPNHLF